MAATLAHPKAFAVWFKDLARWDIKTAKAVQFNHSHPAFRPLKDFAEEVTELVRPWEEPEKQWPVYGVNNVAGIVFSHNQPGKTFNAAYKKIFKDWFFHNPTRANVGSLGRVPKVPPDAITSPEYQVWRVREGLTADFMEVLLCTEFFHNQIEFHRVGAVKQRLFAENLLQIRIPILPIELQDTIVERWQQAQADAAISRKTIAKLETELESSLFRSLGIYLLDKADRPKFLVVSWREMPRWAVSSVIDSALGLHQQLKADFPYLDLGSLASVSYGIQKCPSNRPGAHARPYLRVANVRKGHLDLSEIKTIDVPDPEMESLRLLPGDILFVEGNGSRAELGRVAMWNGEINNCVHQNHLIKVRCDTTKLLPEFAMTWFNTDIGRGHFFRSAKTSSGLGTINSNEVRAAPIPLPSIGVQRQIVRMVNEQRTRIAEERKAAEARHAQAVRDVEEMILGGM